MFRQLILNQILTIILFFYGDPHLPRKIVQDVIDHFSTFLRDYYLVCLQKEVMAIIERSHMPGPNLNSCVSDINSCFSKYGRVFEDVDTESKRFAILKNKGFVDYEFFEMGHRLTEKIVDNKMVLAVEQSEGVHVPLRKTLKMFLEIPGMFKGIVDYVRTLSQSSGVISNILQGRLWLRKYAQKAANVIILPLYIFYDDLEVGNSLGSHAGINKFGAVYASIACLPPRIASKLNSILFTALFHTDDKKKCSNEKVFKKLIDELKFLETEGILVKINDVYYRVKFQLTLILGDNLGLNGILGFVESFRSNFCCRICKIPSQMISNSSVEDPSLLRNAENYEGDVRLNDYTKTGVKEENVFHRLDYHVTENVSIDLMHDILEGVAMYVMRNILHLFIFSKEYFTLTLLKKRIDDFNFGPLESSNKPQSRNITIHRLKNDKLILNMSASEMLCFVRYFGLIIGDQIPKDDLGWILYKYLRKIIDIVTSPRIIVQDAKTLASLIKKHNDLYFHLFGALKPKFHFLVHYPRLLLENGPCIHYWSMRYESRHVDLKSVAQSTNCSKNLLKTITIKQLLKMCKYFHSLECESSVKFGSAGSSSYGLEFSLGVPAISKFHDSVEIDGYMYNTGSFIVLDISETDKVFGRILKIININNEVHFHVHLYDEITFDDDYHSYIVKKQRTTKVVKFADIPSFPICLAAKIDKTLYLATRFQL